MVLRFRLENCKPIDLVGCGGPQRSERTQTAVSPRIESNLLKNHDVFHAGSSRTAIRAAIRNQGNHCKHPERLPQRFALRSAREALLSFASRPMDEGITEAMGFSIHRSAGYCGF